MNKSFIFDPSAGNAAARRAEWGMKRLFFPALGGGIRITRLRLAEERGKRGCAWRRDKNSAAAPGGGTRETRLRLAEG